MTQQGDIFAQLAALAVEQQNTLKRVSREADADSGSITISVCQPHISERYVQLHGRSSRVWAGIRLLTPLGGGGLQPYCLYQTYLLAQALGQEAGQPGRQPDFFRPWPMPVTYPPAATKPTHLVSVGESAERLEIGRIGRDWMRITGIESKLGAQASVDFNRHVSPRTFAALRGFEAAYKRDLRLARLA